MTTWRQDGHGRQSYFRTVKARTLPRSGCRKKWPGKTASYAMRALRAQPTR